MSNRIVEIYNSITGKTNQKLSNKIDSLELELEKKSFSGDLEGVIGSQLISLDVGNKDPYTNNYSVNRGINIIAQSLSQVPLRIYRGQDPMPPDFKLPGTFDLEMPHPNLTLYEITYRNIIYYLNNGELFIEILDDPRLMWEPLNPKYMRPDGYNWIYQNGSETRQIPFDKLIYLPCFDPTGNKRGLAAIDVVKQEINNDNKAREYNAKFFENFGKIGTVLKNLDIENQISSDDMKALVDQFNSLHAGSGKAYKTAGLPPGVDAVESTHNMREMEFSQGRIDARDRILAMLGVHKALLGATDSVDRAVADAAMRQLWIHTIKPMAIRLQQAYNLQFFRRQPQLASFKCRYDFSDIAELQESQTDKMARAKIYREFGYTVNEINDMFDLGMDDVTDPVGDMRFVPSSLILVDDLYIADTPPVPPKKSVDIDSIFKDTKISRRSTTYKRNFDRLDRTITKKMAGKMGRFFAGELRKVLTVIKENKSVKAIDETTLMVSVYDILDKDKDILVDMLKPIYNEGSIKASQLALDTIGVGAESVVNDKVVFDLTNKIRDINNHTYRLIRTQVKESVVAGETIDVLSKRITKVYKFNSARSRTIARTESGAVINRSTYEEYKKNVDIVKKKQWVGGTRESHAAINGQVKDFNDPFDNGLMYPHDPGGSAGEVINCTCCLAAIVD